MEIIVNMMFFNIDQNQKEVLFKNDKSTDFSIRKVSKRERGN